MEVWKYDSVDLSTIVNRIPDKVFNDLPFGLIKLDLLGKIIEYNMAEAALTGFSVESVIGKNFFLEVATCTQTPEFYGRFREGIDRGLLNVQFDYLFDSEMIPTRVRVRMVKMNQFVWLMVTRLTAQGQAVDIARAPTYEPPPQLPYEYLNQPAPPQMPQQTPPQMPLQVPGLPPQTQPMPPRQPMYAPVPAPAMQPQFAPPQVPHYQPQPPHYQQPPQQPQYQQPLQPQYQQPPQPQPQYPAYSPAPTFAPAPAPVPAPAPAAAPGPRKKSGLEDFDFS
jgi:photoactive yellow protein